MKYTFFFVFIIIMMSVGCKQMVSQAPQNPWSTLIIISKDNEVITIANTDDTSTVKYYDGGGFFTGYHKVKVDSLKPYFTMAEKDSIYKLARDIIAVPVLPKIACTEFVGDLKLVIYYGKYKESGSCSQSIEYSGVCNWDTLSDKTIQLHRILKRKIKWWNK
jgi:hypothetical protein